MTLERDTVVAELAELRRRAYGPDSDIAADPAAQARLAELEDSLRVPAGAQKSTTTDAAPPGAASPRPAQGETEPPTDAAGETDPAAAAAGETDPPADAAGEASVDHDRKDSRGARLPWVVAGVAAAVAIVAVTMLSVSELSRVRPEVSLGATEAPDGVNPPALDGPMLDYWGLTGSELDYHGSLGKIDVWTMDGDEDVACIFFSVGGEYWGQNCAVRPLAPLVEFRASEDVVPADSLNPPVPAGSFLRFAWEGDVVNVYIVRNAVLGEAQSSASS